MLNALRELDLTDNEAAVYAHLLRLGKATAYDVVRATGLHRNSTYTALQNLTRKKYITLTQSNRRAYFQALNPRRLLTMAQTHLDKLRELVPQLEKLALARATEIVVHEGEREWRDFWLNAVKHSPKGTINYVMPSISHGWWDLMGRDVNTFIKYQVANKIKLQMIVFTKSKIELENLRKLPKLNEYRYIKRDFNPTGNFAIWGDICYVQSLEQLPVLIEIHNQVIWQVFKQHFDLLWSIGKPVRP